MNRKTNPIYLRHINSKKWEGMKKRRVKSCSSHCECCGKKYNPLFLVLHHHTYERVGRERKKDLAIVCRNCHKSIHFDGAKRISLQGDNLFRRFLFLKSNFKS